MSENRDNGNVFIGFLGIVVFLAGIIFASGIVDIVHVSNDDIVVVDFPLQKVFQGEHYFYKNYTFLRNLDENKTFLFQVNDEEVHMIFEFGNQDTTSYELYENCSVSDVGNKKRTFNRKREYDNNATMKLYSEPIINLDYAVRIYNARYVEKKFNPGIIRDNREIVLKKNTNYCFVITNLVNAKDHVNYLFDWYEGHLHE